VLSRPIHTFNVLTIGTDIQEFKAAMQGEAELTEFCEAARPELLKGGVPELVEAMSSILPEPDKKALLENNELGQFMVDGLQEGLKTNSNGWVDDDLSFIQPWGFEFSEIKVPVIIYQGSEDKMVPYAQGEWLAKHLPQEKLRVHLQQGDGHISIFLGQVDNIIDELKEIAKL
jgi:pimeloyl-ACP methyl ester carboxylesterase